MTLFKTVIEVYNKLEETSATLDKIDLLKKLFLDVDTAQIDKIIYLTLGILHPNYTSESPIGIAEKVAIKSISKMTNLSESEIKKLIDKYGGIGDAINPIYKKKKKTKTLDSYFGKKDTKKQKEQTVDEVYNTLNNIAHQEGKGSTLKKIELLADLLLKSSADESKYILRTILGTLRLGLAEMTIINALSEAFTGSKDKKEYIEGKYNIFPDLGKIGKILAQEGLDGLESINITVGIPIKMMLAQRAKSIEEIFDRMGEKCACEFKYDGERIQAHKNGEKITLFSRNTENITAMYPDLVALIQKLPANNLIVEGEVVAVDPETGKIKSFQELMRRRRKYDITKMMEENPVDLYLFDILYINNKNLLSTPYIKRREILEDLIGNAKLSPDSSLKLAIQKVVSSKEDLNEFFEDSLIECEGLMIKSVSDDSIYQAGSRGYIWLKLKKSYQSKMIDSVDVTIIGAYMGRGRRGGTYGALLCAVYNKDTDLFQSICKLGSGFKDEDLSLFPELFKNLTIEKKAKNVDEVSDKLKPDDWIEPKVVCSVIGDEITLSPDHRAGYELKRKEAGFAIRFPRFLDWRDDKSISDITRVEEILDMYNRQK